MQRVDSFLGNDRRQIDFCGNSQRPTVELLLETFSTVVRAGRLSGGKLEQKLAVEGKPSFREDLSTEAPE
jgi:hypothetical protein